MSNEPSVMTYLLKGISKNAPFPLQWRGIKGEAKQIIRVFRDALKFYLRKSSTFTPKLKPGN